jgi:ribonuclease-3
LTINPELLERIERGLGYAFRDRGLLEQALTHSSFAFENQKPDGAPAALANYERLEFLGDAVLGLVVSDLAMRQSAEAPEGELSKLRAGLVNSERLAENARQLGLGEALQLGRGEESTGGRDKPSILAAAYEAILAAIYLDGGFEPAFRAAAGQFLPLLGALPPLDLLGDFKTPLQEKVQARFKSTPSYRVVAEQGPDHQKTFEVEVSVNGKPWARGHGRSKKEAEQEAARLALAEGAWED